MAKSPTKLRLRDVLRDRQLKMKQIANTLWTAAPVMSKVFGDCLHTCVKFAKQ